MKEIEISVAVIKNQDKIFAAKRGYGEFQGFWEFPGGKIEGMETKEEALYREIKEELSIRVKIEQFFGTIAYDYPTFHLTMHCFICKIIEDTIPKLLEHKEAKWVTKREIENLQWLPANKELIKKLKTILT